jgi:hypothetical protein
MEWMSKLTWDEGYKTGSNDMMTGRFSTQREENGESPGMHLLE